MSPIPLVGARCCSHVVFYWCSLLSLCYVLLVLIDTLCYILLMFVMAPLLCLNDVCRRPFATLRWCLIMAPCALLMLVVAPLLCFISAHHHPLATLYWCLLMSACYVLLVLF